jgi:aspartyl-tRNA(Asn)/glutamyl-tRNA(Gln) amidotransferase subunit A
MNIKGIDDSVSSAISKSINIFTSLGGKVIDITLPHTPYALDCYYVIATAEASSNLARYDGVRYGPRKADTDIRTMYAQTRGTLFGPEVLRRIILGTYVLSAGYYDAYYTQAQRVRSLIRQDFNLAFEKVDGILSPTSPTPAFKLGTKVNDPLQMYLSDIFTLPCSLAGLPGISIPCGFTPGAKPLPIGLQILAKPFAENTLFAIAHAFERATPWHEAHPKVY